jgi:hypothetical protein
VKIPEEILHGKASTTFAKKNNWNPAFKRLSTDPIW